MGSNLTCNIHVALCTHLHVLWILHCSLRGVSKTLQVIGVCMNCLYYTCIDCVWICMHHWLSLACCITRGLTHQCKPLLPYRGVYMYRYAYTVYTICYGTIFTLSANLFWFFVLSSKSAALIVLVQNKYTVICWECLT